MTPYEAAALIGAITGAVYIGYLIIKLIRDKPRLVFEVVSKNFYPAEGNNFFSPIVIRIKVHNKGSRPTTIHHAKLSFNYNSKNQVVEYDGHIEVPPDYTAEFYPQLNLHKDELVIYGQITNCVLTVDHTHDSTPLDLGTIKQMKTD